VDAREKPLRDARHVSCSRDLADEDGEFVTTHPGHRERIFSGRLASNEIASSDRAREAIRDYLERLVTRLTAEGIVDALEAIQAEEKDRVTMAISVAPSHQDGEKIAECALVPQTRQVVVVLLEAKLFLGSLLT
jgi:hypothetical protein